MPRKSGILNPEGQYSTIGFAQYKNDFCASVLSGISVSGVLYIYPNPLNHGPFLRILYPIPLKHISNSTSNFHVH